MDSDSTRLLVGMIYHSTSSPIDTALLRYTRSFFNDTGVLMSSAYSADRTQSSATYAVPTTGTEITIAAACWLGETVQYTFSGSCYHSAGAVACGIGLGVDSATTIVSGKAFTSNTANILDINHVTTYTVATAGLHTFYSLSKVASGNLIHKGAATEGTWAQAKTSGLK